MRTSAEFCPDTEEDGHLHFVSAEGKGEEERGEEMITAYGKIVDNIFCANVKVKYENDKRQYEGEDVTLTIKKTMEKASHRQHKYYRGGIAKWVCENYLNKTEKWRNITPDKFHKYYKTKFLKEWDEDLQEEVQLSSGGLTTKGYANFVDMVRMDLRHPDNKWGMSIDTADPEEYFMMKSEGTWE